MYSLVYTTLVAIQSRTYLTKAELIETNREPIVGDLVYGSDSYYAQIIRVGEGVVEITVIGQIANLQAIYDLVNLKADLTYVDGQLDLTAKLASSNVFTQPQQVPNATLPQHTTNLNQVETMFEMFKQQLRGYNLAMPDLTGKEYLGDGVYRLRTVQGLTIDYNIYNGEYNVNGISTIVAMINFHTFNLPTNNYTVSLIYVSGDVDREDAWVRVNNTINNLGPSLNSSITYDTFTFTNESIFALRSFAYVGTTYNNLTFKLQIEKGTTATPYTVPGQIPQYKIVGEEWC